MASGAQGNGLADLVCPTCFDLGFTISAFRGEVAVDDREKTKDEPQEKQTEGPAAGQPDENSDNANREHQNQPEESQARSRDSLADYGLEATMLKLLAHERTAGSPLVNSGPMKHTHDERVESLFTIPINFDTVELDVKGLLVGDRQPATRAAYIAAFPTVQLIKNGMIPFKYWLEQPCPAHRRDLEPPCVAIRRGVHEYLVENGVGYKETLEILKGYGYVEEWNSSVSFRIGYPDLGTNNGKDESAIPAGGWSVEAYMLDEIPSPWRRPWFPDDGFVLSRRTGVSGNTASDAAFDKAMAWFRDCVLNHQQCSEPESQELPGRLIDIGEISEPDDAPPKLVSTADKRGLYACLSHRWGGETTSLTRDKIEGYGKSIPWVVLSPTFQDAIVFLRKLSAWHEKEFGQGIRYLWIDSLCIIQDSESDWKEQSQKMGDIYSNARITLVEAFSQGREKRLFSKASPKFDPKPIQVKDAQGSTRDLYFRQALLHPDFMVNEGRIPIWERAWAFQERLLSQRLLIFGSEELSWQCQQGSQCECALDQHHQEAEIRMREWKSDGSFTPRLAKPSSRSRLERFLGKNPSQAELRRAWRLVLECYSGLDMTFRKDTLPAIAGLARSFNKQLGGMRYYAGMFYEEQDSDQSDKAKDLSESLLDLLWRLEFLKDARRQLPSPVVPATWSWTHPQGTVVYPFVQDELLAQFAILVHIQPAHNVPRLPTDKSAYTYTVPTDMYVDAPSTNLAFVCSVWRTRLVRTKTSIAIKTMEDREYAYHLGAMSDKIWQHRALGRPVDIALFLAQPPTLAVEEGKKEMDDEALFATMPPIVVYPDSLVTEINGPMFCMPLAKFRHKPNKSELSEKIIFVALLLEAVGHVANNEGTDLNLEGKDPGELVYRRLGLAYTTQGGWSEEHDRIIRGLDPKSIRIV